MHEKNVSRGNTNSKDQVQSCTHAETDRKWLTYFKYSFNEHCKFDYLEIFNEALSRQSSGHMIIERRINVDATLWHCITEDATLYNDKWISGMKILIMRLG